MHITGFLSYYCSYNRPVSCSTTLTVRKHQVSFTNVFSVPLWLLRYLALKNMVRTCFHTNQRHRRRSHPRANCFLDDGHQASQVKQKPRFPITARLQAGFVPKHHLHTTEILCVWSFILRIKSFSTKHQMIVFYHR